MVQPLAPKKKAINKAVTPTRSTLPVSRHPNAGQVEKAPAPGTNLPPDYKPGFGMPTIPKPGNGKPTDDPNIGRPTPPQTGGDIPPHTGGSKPPQTGGPTPPQTGGPTPPPGNNQGLMWQPVEYNPVGGNASNPTYTPPVNNYKPTDYQQVGGNAARPEYNAPQGNYTPAEYESVTGNAPQFESNTPQTEFNGRDYQSNGYTGVQGKSDYKYDPRSESMVQNQITGLLDPNSALMRKAISQAQGYSAARGLQSSSIGSETALSSMIDKALPIAQQDASTNANADQIGWQQSFSADQSNLSREHDASMFDKQGELKTNLQNDQLNFQNTQNNANRAQQTELQQLQYKQSLGLLDAQGQQRMQELNAQQGFQANENQLNREQQGELQQLQYLQSLGMLDAQGAQRMQELNAQQGFQANENQLSREQQAELQQLQYKQSLGMLDAQGAQRMQELNAQQGFQDYMQDKQFNQNNATLDKQAQIQKERDKLMNQFDSMKMDKAYLQDLEKTKLTWERADTEFARNLDANTRLQYQNATADAYNRYLEQVALVFSNPNMTPAQQNAGVNYLKNMFESQRQQMQVIYGVSGGGNGSGQQTGISNPNQQLKNPSPGTGPQQPIIPGGGNVGTGGGGGNVGTGGGRPGGNNMRRLMQR